MKYNCKNSTKYMNGIVSNSEIVSTTVKLNGTTVPLTKVKDWAVEVAQDDIKIFGSAYSQQLTINFFDLDNTFTVSSGDAIKVSIICDTIESKFPTFYVYSVDYDKISQVKRVVGYDAMCLGNNKIFHPSAGVTYTLTNLASACATAISANFAYNLYDNSAISSLSWTKADINIGDNGISYRELIRSIAEVTGSIAYINSTNHLVFRQLGYSIDEQTQDDFNIDTSTYTIDKSQIFSYDIDVAQVRQLGGVINSNELEDNRQYPNNIPDNKLLQIIYCNPLLTLKSNAFIDTVITNIYNKLYTLTLQPYTLGWRGNAIMEIGDIFCIEGQTNQYFPYISEKMIYNGGIHTNSEWQCDNNGSRDVNLGGSNIGTSSMTTRAIVDKANNNIQLLVGEVWENGQIGTQSRIDINQEGISSLVTTTDGMRSSIIQNADNISLVVQGPTGVNPAYIKIDSIVDAINNGPTGSSGVVISADHIDLEGVTTFVKPSDIGPGGTTTIDGGRITTGTISANRLDLSGTLTVGSPISNLTNDEGYINSNDVGPAGSTSIYGGRITTGSIQSNNYTDPTGSSHYSQAGTKMDLDNGVIQTPYFYSDSSGAGFKGDLDGASGTFNGNLTADTTTFNSLELAVGNNVTFKIDGDTSILGDAHAEMRLTGTVSPTVTFSESGDIVISAPDGILKLRGNGIDIKDNGIGGYVAINNAIITDSSFSGSVTLSSSNYGTSLPSSGSTGEVFFKVVN